MNGRMTEIAIVGDVLCAIERFYLFACQYLKRRLGDYLLDFICSPRSSDWLIFAYNFALIFVFTEANDADDIHIYHPFVWVVSNGDATSLFYFVSENPLGWIRESTWLISLNWNGFKVKSLFKYVNVSSLMAQALTWTSNISLTANYRNVNVYYNGIFGFSNSIIIAHKYLHTGTM